MIDRNVNVEDLSKFDFFNDGKDTVRYLQSTSRLEEANILNTAYENWLKTFAKWAKETFS